jgi:magnesium chelatase family protein
LRQANVARTRAELEGQDGVRRRHIVEVLSYRRIAPAQAA